MEQPTWRSEAACARLSPAEADSMFFPSSGGKPTRAKKFCGGHNCPVSVQCLNEAISNNLDGFYAGTTKAERDQMREYYELATTPINETVNQLVPEKTPKVRPRKKSSRPTDTVEYLQTINSPLDFF